MRDLLREVDDVVKKRSLQGLLRDMNKEKWLQIRRPAITKDHADSRLAWTRSHEYYILEDWKKVIWSDECTVERGVGI